MDVKAYRLTYLDGRVVDVKVTMKGQVLLERKFGSGKVPNVEGTLYMGWMQHGQGTEFDAWLETVDDIDPVEGEDPTAATLSTVSQDSQSLADSPSQDYSA